MSSQYRSNLERVNRHKPAMLIPSQTWGSASWQQYDFVTQSSQLKNMQLAEIINEDHTTTYLADAVSPQKLIVGTTCPGRHPLSLQAKTLHNFRHTKQGVVDQTIIWILHDHQICQTRPSVNNTRPELFDIKRRHILCSRLPDYLASAQGIRVWATHGRFCAE